MFWWSLQLSTVNSTIQTNMVFPFTKQQPHLALTDSQTALSDGHILCSYFDSVFFGLVSPSNFEKLPHFRAPCSSVSFDHLHALQTGSLATLSGSISALPQTQERKKSRRQPATQCLICKLNRGVRLPPWKWAQSCKYCIPATMGEKPHKPNFDSTQPWTFWGPSCGIDFGVCSCFFFYPKTAVKPKLLRETLQKPHGNECKRRGPKVARKLVRPRVKVSILPREKRKFCNKN